MKHDFDLIEENSFEEDTGKCPVCGGVLRYIRNEFLDLIGQCTECYYEEE